MKEVKVSDKLILFNLHQAGLKASDITSSNSKVNNSFGETIINTGVKEDAKDESGSFDNKNHLYEVGLICDLSKITDIDGKSFSYTEDPSNFSKSEDLQNSINNIEDNKIIFDKLDKEALEIFLRYMKKFVGSSNCGNINEKNITKTFYTSKDKIKIEKYAFQAENIKKPKPNKDIEQKNTVNFLLYKIAYTVGVKSAN